MPIGSHRANWNGGVLRFHSQQCAGQLALRDGSRSAGRGHLPTHATGRFGAVEIMTLCGQTTFRSNLTAAPLCISGRAGHRAVAPARWPQLGADDRFTDGAFVCIIHTLVVRT
jgi:hypothetical protein